MIRTLFVLVLFWTPQPTQGEGETLVHSEYVAVTTLGSYDGTSDTLVYPNFVAATTQGSHGVTSDTQVHQSMSLSLHRVI